MDLDVKAESDGGTDARKEGPEPEPEPEAEASADEDETGVAYEWYGVREEEASADEVGGGFVGVRSGSTRSGGNKTSNSA